MDDDLGKTAPLRGVAAVPLVNALPVTDRLYLDDDTFSVLLVRLPVPVKAKATLRPGSFLDHP
jgi:hypothetical protein